MPNKNWTPKSGDYSKKNASQDKKRINTKIRREETIVYFLVSIIVLLLIYSFFKL